MNIADTLQRDAREIVFIARRKLEQRRGRAVVVNDAAAIGIHPAELERGFGAPLHGGITIQCRGDFLVLWQTLAMLVGQCAQPLRNQAMEPQPSGSDPVSESIIFMEKARCTPIDRGSCRESVLR